MYQDTRVPYLFSDLILLYDETKLLVRRAQPRGPVWFRAIYIFGKWDGTRRIIYMNKCS